MKAPLVVLGQQLGWTSLDGFCNELSVPSSSAFGKPIYVVLRRRRWKVKGSKKHYSNHYDLQPKGAKITQEYTAFLKGIH